MSESCMLSKAELEKYIAARPNTRQTVGYFDEDGNFTRGPFYQAQLGSQCVSMVEMPGYIQAAGVYMWRQAALDAAKAVQEKCRQLLSEGKYSKDAGVPQKAKGGES